MLEKMLDKYFRKKLQSILKNILYTFYVDYRYKETICEDEFELYIKNKKYNDNQYRSVMTFKDCMLIYYLSNAKELAKEVIKNVKDYLKENQNDRFRKNDN